MKKKKQTHARSLSHTSVHTHVHINADLINEWKQTKKKNGRDAYFSVHSKRKSTIFFKACFLGWFVQVFSKTNKKISYEGNIFKSLYLRKPMFSEYQLINKQLNSFLEYLKCLYFG